MTSKLPARRNTAVTLFDDATLSPEELIELQEAVGEKTLRYLRDQTANLGVLAMSMNNIQREISAQKVALSRTSPAQELKTLRQDEKSVKERGQLIMQKQLGVLENALKGFRKNSPMYKKILALMQPMQQTLEGGEQS